MNNKSKNRTPEEIQTLVTFIAAKKSEGLKAKQIQELLEWSAGQYEAFVTKTGLGREKRSLTNEEIATIVSMKKSGSSLQEMANAINITKSTLETKMHELKLTSSTGTRIDLTKEQLDEAKKLIKNKVTQEEISKILGVSIKVLRARLKDNNIETKLYKVKHDYFSIIDSEEKAYFLGMMYADGYNGEVRNQIKLKLHRKDRSILEVFAKALTYGESLPPFTEEHFKTDTLSVQLYSEQLCNDLKSLGCMQAKSLIIKLPTYLTSDLMKHFLRGYFDGDGSVFEKVRPGGSVGTIISFTGCFGFISELNDFLVKELYISNNKVSHQKEDSNAWQVAYSSYSDVQTIRNYLYSECTPELYLKRKFDKFPTQEYSDRIQLEQKIIKSQKVTEAQLGRPKESLQKAITITDVVLLTEAHYKSVIEASDILGINKDTLKAAIYKNRLVQGQYLVKYRDQDVTLQLQTNL